MSYRRIYMHLSYYLIVYFLTTLLIATVLAPQIQLAHGGGKSPYNSGYDHGCDDAGKSNPSDRYINQPEKGPSFHTNEFMQGYNAGYNGCSDDNGSSTDAESNKLSPDSDSRNNQGGIYWYGICAKLDFFITEPCEDLVTNNGYGLTPDGKRVAACIAGGGLLTLLDPSLQTLIRAQPLGSAVGCHTILSDTGAGDILRGLFGK